jgi:hypothetical protein
MTLGSSIKQLTGTKAAVDTPIERLLKFMSNFDNDFYRKRFEVPLWQRGKMNPIVAESTCRDPVRCLIQGRLRGILLHL